MSADDFYKVAAEEIDAPPFPNSPGVAYSAVWVAYYEPEDRYYLVSHDCTLAMPTPPNLHGHFADMIAAAGDRLHCHPGFVKWPPDGNGDVQPFFGASNAPGADQA